jgi:predicted RNase H-like HicB family nuclease
MLPAVSYHATVAEGVISMTNRNFEAQIEALLRRPYHKLIYGDPEQGYLIKVVEWPGCLTAGETAQEAVRNLPEAMAAWAESMLIDGLPIPEPAAPLDVWPGFRVFEPVPVDAPADDN